MEKDSNSIDEQKSGVDTDKNRHLEGINRVVKDTEEDLIDNMPDSHPEPKPTENNTQ